MKAIVTIDGDRNIETGFPIEIERGCFLNDSNEKFRFKDFISIDVKPEEKLHTREEMFEATYKACRYMVSDAWPYNRETHRERWFDKTFPI